MSVLLQYLKSFILVNKENVYEECIIMGRKKEYTGTKEVGNRLTGKQQIPRNKRIDEQKKESQNRVTTPP